MDTAMKPALISITIIEIIFLIAFAVSWARMDMVAMLGFGVLLICGLLAAIIVMMNQIK